MATDVAHTKTGIAGAGAPRLTVSLAAFVLLCFFLPWLQVSCPGLRDTASGRDLAHGGEPTLWLVPLAMLAVLFMGLARFVWERMPALFGLVSIVGGGLSAYLIYRERYSTGRWDGLISTYWTAWF
jgi:hypothetical protein